MKEKKKRYNFVMFADGIVGEELIEFVIQKKYPVKMVVVRDYTESAYVKQIIRRCNIARIPVYNEVDAALLRKNRIDAGILAWWPDIIKKDIIDAVPKGIMNIHPAYLPYGRGKHAYYWSIVEGYPFGIAIHYIDEGIDTGDIIFRRAIPIGIMDTGESLYRKGCEEAVSLFKEVADAIFSLELPRIKQLEKYATYRISDEIERNSEIFLDGQYTGRQLIDAIRARTFWHGPSAYFYEDGVKYSVRIKIEPY